ncbi:MAG: 2'-5' RNA ligase family protein [Victivallales bacterium]|jgi:hypothetical protein|nr:2'-5' RNA ligase family protein [Victivallales bacterium]MBT7165229.1 2'-5' RNA ligase family protein [Victivallales bacterium]
MKPKNITVLVMPVSVFPALQAFREAEMIKPTRILGPHVSILGPLAPGDVTESVIARLAEAVRPHRPICAVLPQFCVFPDVPVLYLSVYPVAPFEALREVALRVISDHQPTFEAPVFHLSLGLGFELRELPELMCRAHSQLDSLLPLETTLGELLLADRIDGVWHVRETFPLGQ